MAADDVVVVVAVRLGYWLRHGSYINIYFSLLYLSWVMLVDYEMFKYTALFRIGYRGIINIYSLNFLKQVVITVFVISNKDTSTQ